MSRKVPFIVFVIRQFENVYRRLKKENRAEKRGREKVIEAVNVCGVISRAMVVSSLHKFQSYATAVSWLHVSLITKLSSCTVITRFL